MKSDTVWITVNILESFVNSLTIQTDNFMVNITLLCLCFIEIIVVEIDLHVLYYMHMICYIGTFAFVTSSIKI